MSMASVVRLHTVSSTLAKGRLVLDGPHRFDRIVLDSLQEGLFVVDPTRRILFWNRAAESLTGYSPDETLGSRCNSLLQSIDGECEGLCEWDCPIVATLADGRDRERDVFFHHRDGYRLPVTVRVMALRDETGKVTGAAEAFLERKHSASSGEELAQLEEMALFDPLTGVGNRRFIEKTLEERLEELRRYGWQFGVLFIDVDGLKRINDTAGHTAGDRLLSLVARSIRGGLRSFDAVGRWGGDEFVVIVANVDADGLGVVAERIRRLVKGMSLTGDTTQFKTTISIGATCAGTGDSVVELLRRADELMYRGKQQGGDRTIP